MLVYEQIRIFFCVYNQSQWWLGFLPLLYFFSFVVRLVYSFPFEMFFFSRLPCWKVVSLFSCPETQIKSAVSKSLTWLKYCTGVSHPCRKPGLDFQGLAIVKLTRGENVVVTFVVNQHRIVWISVFNNVRNVFKRLWWRSRTKISTLRPHILQVMSYGK